MVAEVRRFNRTYAAHIGALNDRFLGQGRPLGEARLLWEIRPEGCELRSLRSRLDLDSGYVSRLLRSLEAAGLVTVVPDAADRRTRIARLTPAGLAERAILDERSDGCGALKNHEQAPSEIKRMWVADAARGLGIGLLVELEARALERGARTVRLETNRNLAEAIAMYRSAGYVEVPAFNDEPFAHNWFEKELRDRGLLDEAFGRLADNPPTGVGSRSDTCATPAPFESPSRSTVA